MKRNSKNQDAARVRSLDFSAVWNLLRGFCLLPLLYGCAPSAKFTKLRVSNYRGTTLSEYTARGAIYPVEGGYRIIAVERESGTPHRVLSRYPDGWQVTVLGPRVTHWRTEKPDWLVEREAKTE